MASSRCSYLNNPLRRPLLLLMTAILLLPAVSFGHAPGPVEKKTGSDLTVSYAIEIKSRKRKTGKAETYNGGTQTIFISDRGSRSRLVSLMRIQSIFVMPGNDTSGVAVILRESGKEKRKTCLSAGKWAAYNRKYEGAVCHSTEETLDILHEPCRKAIVQLKDGQPITVYYTTAIRHAGLAAAQPAFASVPGLVLKYEYTYKKGTIAYTATALDRNPIDPAVFRIP